MKEEHLLLLSVQKLINQVVVFDYIIIILGDESMCQLVEEYAQKRAKEYGEQQKAEGVLETLVSLAKKKLLTYDEAAKEANMSKSEFMKLVQG